MKSRIARFKDLKSTKSQHGANIGVPVEVLEMITAKTTYNIMSPGKLGGQLSPNPPVLGGDAGVFRLGMVTCPPGNGPGLHVHWKTHETFMALTGKWEIQWGDEGQEKTVIEPYDLIAVPPEVTRTFKNVSDADAHLLVVIQGKPEEFDDVGRAPITARRIAEKYGQGMVDKLMALGWQFTLDANAPPEAMQP